MAAGDNGGVWMESRFEVPEPLEPTSTESSKQQAELNHGKDVDTSQYEYDRIRSPADVSTRVDRAVYALFVVFGLGSWITINGLFAELPLFYKDLPE